MNEELTATGEELRVNLDQLARAGHELRESEEKYRLLFENLLDGFAYCRMIYDEDGQPDDSIYLEVNHAFDEIIGAKNVTGKQATDVFPGGLHDREGLAISGLSLKIFLSGSSPIRCGKRCSTTCTTIRSGTASM